MVDYATCMDGCGNNAAAQQYCQYVAIITPISYGGSIVCVEEYEASKPGGMTTDLEALWARVWFEVGCQVFCSSFTIDMIEMHGHESSVHWRRCWI